MELFLRWEALKNKFSLDSRLFFKYRQLQNAIPSTWKTTIREEVPRNFIGEQHFPIINTRMAKIETLTSKEIYTTIIFKKSEKPTSESTIERKLNNNNIQWVQAYMLARKVTMDSYTRAFHTKTTHNILYLNKKLTLFGLSESTLCTMCKREDETIAHLFAECEVVRGLWILLGKHLSEHITLPALTPQSAFLGFLDENILINQILLTFKITIYKSRELGSCNLTMITKKIKLTMKIEDIISAPDERRRNYNEAKWGVIRFLENN